MFATPQEPRAGGNLADSKLDFARHIQRMRNDLKCRKLRRLHDPAPQDSGEFPVVARRLRPWGSRAGVGAGEDSSGQR